MTALPVDFAKRPWKWKYLNETPGLSDWFIFGERIDGTVDISDGQQDVFINVPRSVAEIICEARRNFCCVIERECGVNCDDSSDRNPA